MNLFEAILLGIVQGLTEFIPVSSSGHLVLFHELFGLEHVGLAFDVALHLGTLLALIIFFYGEIVRLINGILGRNDYKRLAWLILLATFPAAVLGYLLEGAAESTFRSVFIVSFNLIFVALLMLLAEKIARSIKHKTPLKHTSPKQALAVGFAQALALVPGVSRSGITITTGLFTGLDRVSATRFSFLLGIPIMVGAITKVMLSGAATSQISQETGIFVAGILAAFVSGLFAIRFLLKFLSSNTLNVFAYYRIALGIITLALAI